MAETGFTLNGKLGAHVQGVHYNRDNLLPLIKALGGRYALFANDWEFAAMWAQSGGIPILRVKTTEFWDDDGDRNIPNPEAYADHVCNLLDMAEAHAPAFIKGKGLGHAGNELATHLPERTDPWLARSIRRYAARGRQCVVGNWAFKNRPQLAKMPLTVRALLDTGSFMGYHEGLYEDVWQAKDAIANGAIGGFLAEQRQYGFRAMITEFAASATAHDGWEIMFAQRGGAAGWAAQIDQAMRLALDPNVEAVLFFSMPKWNEGRGFWYDNPEPEHEHSKLRREIATMNRSFVVTLPPTQQPDLPPAPESLGEQVAWQVQKTVANVANIRRGINPKANDVIGTVKVGDRITASAQETEQLNGYRWRYVTKPFTGWLSNVATLTSPDAPPEAVIQQIVVPFVSQLGAEADLRHNDCSNAVAAMLALWTLTSRGLPAMPLLQEVDNLIHLSPLANMDQPVGLTPFRNFCALLGVNTALRADLRLPVLLSEIDAGRPVAVLGNYFHFNPTFGKRMGHYLLLVGYTENTLIVHDPYYLGEYARIPTRQFELAQTDLIGSDGKAFAGAPYQGLTIA